MPRPQEHLRGVLIIIGFVAIVVGGVWTGRAVSGLLRDDPQPTPKATRPEPRPAPPNPVRESARPASGFAHSREGAGAAAASHSIAMVHVAVADPLTRTRTYASITTRAARSELLALAASSQAVLQQNLAGGPGPVVLQGAPLGYRIVSYTPGRAVVDLWSVGIVGGAARPPVATWKSNLITLKWEDRTWRVESFRSEPGLTPAPGARSNPAEVLAEADKYQGYDQFNG